MKARTGFVSNSSSTSFIIVKSAYPSIIDLAQEMVVAREWEDDIAYCDWLESLREELDDDTGIAFPTCNFATFILPVGDYWLIETCNNHSFYEHLDGNVVRSNPNPSDSLRAEVLGLADKLKALGGEADRYGASSEVENLMDFLEFHLNELGHYVCKDKSAFHESDIKKADVEEIVVGDTQNKLTSYAKKVPSIVTEHCNDIGFHIPEDFFGVGSKPYTLRMASSLRGAISEVVEEDADVRSFGIAVTVSAIRDADGREKAMAKAISSLLMERARNDFNMITYFLDKMIEDGIIKHNPFSDEDFYKFMEEVRETYDGYPKVCINHGVVETD